PKIERSHAVGRKEADQIRIVIRRQARQDGDPKACLAGVIAKLNAAIVETLADPALRERIAAMGEEIPPRDQQTPEALAAFQKAEIDKWWPIIKAANIKAE